MCRSLSDEMEMAGAGAVYHLSPGNSAGTFISKLELLSGHSFHYTGRLFAVVIPIYWFDKRYDVNYMFVNWPSAGSPLVWLADRMGNPGYLIGYAALVFLCMLLMDAGYLIVAGKRNQKLFF